MTSLKSPKYWRAVEGYERQKKEAMNETKEQTIEEMGAEMAGYAERQAIDAINTYYVNQQGEATCKRGKDAAGALIRQYLQLHDESELEDAERGLKAILQTRRAGKDNYDVRSMTQAQVVKLWKAGCLVVDTEALNLQANAALRMDAEPQRIPSGETTYLRVVKE